MQLGHKFAIERFLFVGDAGIAVTLMRIPHVVAIITEGGATVLKAAQPIGSTKEQLVAADQEYRKQLVAPVTHAAASTPVIQEYVQPVSDAAPPAVSYAASSPVTFAAAPQPQLVTSQSMIAVPQQPQMMMAPRFDVSLQVRVSVLPLRLYHTS